MYLPLSLSSFSLFLISLSLSLHNVQPSLSSHLCPGLFLSSHLSFTMAYIDRCLSCEVPLGTIVRHGSDGAVGLVVRWRGPLMEALNLASNDGLPKLVDDGL